MSNPRPAFPLSAGLTMATSCALFGYASAMAGHKVYRAIVVHENPDAVGMEDWTYFILPLMSFLVGAISITAAFRNYRPRWLYLVLGLVLLNILIFLTPLGDSLLFGGGSGTLFG